MSREEAITILDCERPYGSCGCGATDEEIEEALNMAIKALEQEQKSGYWIFDEILDRHYYCSECKSMGADYWDYCPYCGAKMVEPQEMEIHCTFTDSEIAKSFIEDVEAVKDLLPKAEGSGEE